MYVNCDMCKENVGGDTQIRILKRVPIRGNHGDCVRERYETAIYTPVQRNHISDINIYYITDDTGRRKPFQAGKQHFT